MQIGEKSLLEATLILLKQINEVKLLLKSLQWLPSLLFSYVWLFVTPWTAAR